MYPILAKQRKHIYKKYRHVTISNQRYIKHDKGKDTVIILKKTYHTCEYTCNSAYKIFCTAFQ